MSLGAQKLLDVQRVRAGGLRHWHGEEIAHSESLRLYLVDTAASDGGKHQVVGRTLESGQVEWSNPENRTGIEMLESLADSSPTPPVGESASFRNESDFRTIRWLRIAKELINRDVAVLGQYAGPREEAVSAIVGDNLARDVVVEGNTLETVHLLSEGFCPDRMDPRPFVPTTPPGETSPLLPEA